MSDSFYRYVRPERFDFRIGEMIKKPKGGVVFRFERIESSHYYFFVASRCGDDQMFSKTIAALMCEHRADIARISGDAKAGNYGMLALGGQILIANAISFCLNYAPKVPTIESIYRGNELYRIGSTAQKILLNNERQERLANEAFAEIQERAIKESYAAIHRLGQ